MRDAEVIDQLRAAVTARGLVPGAVRKPRRGKPSVTLVWLRPEPVVLCADAASGVLLLEAYLPFVLPGGRMHQRIKAMLAEGHPSALCRSRAGALSIGLPAHGNWTQALVGLLAIADALHALLQAEWPDYAHGAFAAALR